MTIRDPFPTSTVAGLFQHFSDWCSCNGNCCSILENESHFQERRLKRINATHGFPSAINDKANKFNEDCSALTVQELEEVQYAIIHFTQSQSFKFPISNTHLSGLVMHALGLSS